MRVIWGVKHSRYDDGAVIWCENYRDAYIIAKSFHWLDEEKGETPDDFIIIGYIIEEVKRDVD